MKLNNHVLIIGGDTILNLIIATIFTKQGHDTAIVNENKNRAFHHTNLFLGREGGDKLSELGIVFGEQHFSNKTEIASRLLESIRITNKGRVHFFGEDYRKIHKGQGKIMIHMTPHRKKTRCQLEKHIYKLNPSLYGNWRRFMPRALKSISIPNPALTILTTPPSFIRGLNVSHEGGMRIQSLEVENLYLCECAKHQIENFSDLELFKQSLKLYISDIQYLTELAKDPLN